MACWNYNNVGCGAVQPVVRLDDDGNNQGLFCVKVLQLNDCESGGGAEIVFQKTSSLLGEDASQIQLRKSCPYDGILCGLVNGFGLINLLYALQVTVLICFWRPDIVHIHNFSSRISFLPLVFMRGLKVIFRFSIIHTAHDFHLVCPNTGLLRYTDQGGYRACTSCADSGQWLNVVWKNCDRRGRIYSWLRYVRHKVSYDWLHIHKLFDCIVCPSEALRSAIRLRFPYVKTQLLRNPSFIASEALHSQTKNTTQEKTLAYFGRLQPEKGVAQYLAERYNRAVYPRFLIYGDGEEEGRIRTIIQELKLTGHVFLMGKIPQIEVGAAIQAIDAVAVPSLCQENCPLVVCDALKLGKIVVSESRGGVSELLEQVRRGNTEFLNQSNYVKNIESIYREVHENNKLGIV